MDTGAPICQRARIPCGARFINKKATGGCIAATVNSVMPLTTGISVIHIETLLPVINEVNAQVY